MCVLCSSYTISCKMVEYETRLTEDGLPPERTLLCAFVWSLKKACIQTKRFWPTSRSVKSTPCCVCVPQSCCCTLVMLQPLTRIITLRRSCFTERGAPLEACTGRYASGWHCYRGSMLNIIGDARTCMFCKLTNSWRSVINSVRLWGIHFSGCVMRRSDLAMVPKTFLRKLTFFKHTSDVLDGFGSGGMTSATRRASYR